MDQGNSPQVKFESEEWQPSKPASQKKSFSITKLVMAYSGGYIKDEKQAQYVLLGFVIIAVIIMAILFFMGGSSDVKTFPEDTINQPYLK